MKRFFRMVLSMVLCACLTAAATVFPQAAVVNPDEKNLQTCTCGDVNFSGDTNSTDALLILKKAIGGIQFTGTQTDRADLDCSEKINTTDALIALQLAVGKRERTARCDRLVSEKLEGVFSGTVTEKANATQIGGSFNMHFGDLLRVGNEWWSYYIAGNDAGKMSTGLATSADGINFIKQGIMVEPSADSWDNIMTSFAGVWLDNGVYYLVYEGSGTSCNGAIGLATSTDGLHFTKQGKILNYSGTGIERINIGTPDLYKEGDTWYLFYHTFDGVDCQICVASGPDLLHLTKYAENPIVPTVSDTFESGTTGRRDIVKYGNMYYMVFETSTDQPYGDASWGHSFARSSDLIHWQQLGRTLYPATGYQMGNDGPNWYVEGDEVFVCFRASGNTTSRTRLVYNRTAGSTAQTLTVQTSSLNQDAEFLYRNTAASNESFRYADLTGEVVYKIDLQKYPGALVTMNVFQNYLIQASGEDGNWKTVYNYSLYHPGQMTSGGNFFCATVDSALYTTGRYLYIRLSNTDPSQGWGGSIVDLSVLWFPVN